MIDMKLRQEKLDIISSQTTVSHIRTEPSLVRAELLCEE